MYITLRTINLPYETMTMRLKGCVRDIFKSSFPGLACICRYCVYFGDWRWDYSRYLIVLQDFAEQHKHRAREVLGPNAGAEIIALGGAIGGVTSGVVRKWHNCLIVNKNQASAFPHCQVINWSGGQMEEPQDEEETGHWSLVAALVRQCL